VPAWYHPLSLEEELVMIADGHSDFPLDGLPQRDCAGLAPDFPRIEPQQFGGLCDAEYVVVELV